MASANGFLAEEVKPEDSTVSEIKNFLNKANNTIKVLNPFSKFGANDGPNFIRNTSKPVQNNAILINFEVEEGLYLDSKTTSFSATWRSVVKFEHILLASGLWRKVEERNAKGENLWAISMREVEGAYSWYSAISDPSLDVIVDFGGP